MFRQVHKLFRMGVWDEINIDVDVEGDELWLSDFDFRGIESFETNVEGRTFDIKWNLKIKA